MTTVGSRGPFSTLLFPGLPPTNHLPTWCSPQRLQNSSPTKSAPCCPRPPEWDRRQPPPWCAAWAPPSPWQPVLTIFSGVSTNCSTVCCLSTDLLNCSLYDSHVELARSRQQLPHETGERALPAWYFLLHVQGFCPCFSSILQPRLGSHGDAVWILRSVDT